MKKETAIIHAGRDKKWTHGLVNPPILRASTILFDTIDEMNFAAKNSTKGKMIYGQRGTSTHFAFQQAMTELEGGVGCALYPSGLAAIVGALLSFLKAGDHLLMVDSAYEPTRVLCDNLLKGYGIQTTYYDPLITSDIENLIQKNTKVLFLESPGSITMEIQDVPTLAKIAHQHGITVMLDNTWASPINSKPFLMGVDISIVAATKYIVGHSDVLMGIATANETHWEMLCQNSYLLGYCISPDDVYLAARGLRTVSVRMAQHEKNALQVATFLSLRQEVDHIRHPAFANCPGHEVFKRDFNGSNGLFSFVLKRGSQQAIHAFVENMSHFKIGFSWGGFESLILYVSNIDKIRTATHWDNSKPLIRLHIGLENVSDLIEDLDNAFVRYNQVLNQ